MRFKDVPRNEHMSGRYSKETIRQLMSAKRIEFRSYLRKSAARNIPLILGSYIAVCSCFAGYALAHDESILIFKVIYFGLAYLWSPFIVMLPVIWYRRKPTEEELIEELGWYRELLDAGELKA